MRVWGYPTEARVYNPLERKLDLKTISCYFIGYRAWLKGYRFYYFIHSTRIVETGNAKFLENGEDSESLKSWDVSFEENRTVIIILTT